MRRTGRLIALRNTAVLAIIFSFALISEAQTPKEAADQWRAAHEQQILQEFTALLSIPNVASDTANIRAQCGCAGGVAGSGGMWRRNF